MKLDTIPKKVKLFATKINDNSFYGSNICTLTIGEPSKTWLMIHTHKTQISKASSDLEEGKIQDCFVTVNASLNPDTGLYTTPLVRLVAYVSRDIYDTYHLPLPLFEEICQEEKTRKLDDSVIESLFQAANTEILKLKERLDKLEDLSQNAECIPPRIPAYMKRY